MSGIILERRVFLGGEGGGVMEVEVREGRFVLQYTNWTVRS